MVSSTPRPHFTPGKDPVPILQEAGWAPGPVWTGGKSRPHRDFLPTFFFSGIFQHICNGYCQHRSCSQSVHRTRDIITPHITVPFDPSLSLSRTLFSYTSHTFPCPSLHSAQECKVDTLCGPCATLSHIHSSTKWARDRLCSYAFMALQSTHHTRMGRFPFHSYRYLSTVTRVTPTLPLHGVWDRGHRISR